MSAHVQQNKVQDDAALPAATRPQILRSPSHPHLDKSADAHAAGSPGENNGVSLREGATALPSNGHEHSPTDGTVVASSDGGTLISEEEEEYLDARSDKFD